MDGTLNPSVLLLALNALPPTLPPTLIDRISCRENTCFCRATPLENVASYRVSRVKKIDIRHYAVYHLLPPNSTFLFSRVKEVNPIPRLPAIRACIFDMDGLLINTETININTVNEMLARYDRPAATPSILASLMGSPTSTDDGDFHEWAQLPITAEEYNRESDRITTRDFPQCRPLPGARSLLSNLRHAKSASGEAISVALASGSVEWTYELKLKSTETKELLELIPAKNRILSFDPRMAGRSKKPAPDIFLLALQVVNDAREQSGETPILPAECLVFEDSIVGVEAGRRAGMRVVWVPHPDLASEYSLIEEKVLAGPTRVAHGDDGQLGKVDDGWAERLADLEQFNYEKYGIQLPH